MALKWRKMAQIGEKVVVNLMFLVSSKENFGWKLWKMYLSLMNNPHRIFWMDIRQPGSYYGAKMAHILLANFVSIFLF